MTRKSTNHYKAALLELHQGMNEVMRQCGEKPLIDDEKFSSLALTEQVVVILFRGGVNIKSSIERAIATVVGIVLEDEGLAFRKGRKPDQVFMNLAPFLQEKLAEGAIQPFQAIPYKSYVAVGMEGVVAVFDTNVGATEPWERKKS